MFILREYCVVERIYPQFTHSVMQVLHSSVTISNSHPSGALTVQDLQFGVKYSNVKMAGASFAHPALSFTELLTAGKFPVKLKRERDTSQNIDLAATFQGTKETKQIVVGPCFFICIVELCDFTIRFPFPINIYFLPLWSQNLNPAEETESTFASCWQELS